MSAIFLFVSRLRIELRNLASDHFGIDRIEDLSIPEANAGIDEVESIAPASRARA